MNANVKAFLDMIAISEIGAALLTVSDNGYNVLVGSTAAKPLLFHDYSQHPGIYNPKFNSTAAGRYQFIKRTWLGLATQLSLKDFSPPNQDIGCQELLRQRNALTDVQNGNIVVAVGKCSLEWASLPGGNSGQHQNKINMLIAAYQDAGGVLA